GDQQPLVAYAVCLERAPVVVGAVAIDLHDQALLGPVQVDLDARDEAVAGRLRQAVLAQQGAEATLERRPRGRGPGDEALELAACPRSQVLERDQLAHQRLGE